MIHCIRNYSALLAIVVLASPGAAHRAVARAVRWSAAVANDALLRLLTRWQTLQLFPEPQPTAVRSYRMEAIQMIGIAAIGIALVVALGLVRNAIVAESNEVASKVSTIGG